MNRAEIFGENFGSVELIFYVIGLIISTLIAIQIRNKNRNNEIYKFYLPRFYFHLGANFIFGIFYLFAYEGGDSAAYYDGAIAMKNLFFEDPSAYFLEIFKSEKNAFIPNYFSFSTTGMPPSWIYRDPNSFSVSKFYSVFAIFSFNSYFLLNLFAGLFSSWVSWRFFKFLSTKFNLKPDSIYIALFYIPTASISLHCLMKDSLVYSAFLIGIMGLFYLFIFREKILISLFYIIFSVFILSNTRSFFLLLAATGFIFYITFSVGKLQKGIFRFIYRSVFLILGITSALLIFMFFGNSINSVLEDLKKESEIIHKDVSQNETYTGAKYDLGNVEFTNSGLVSKIPETVFVSLFRPFPWEIKNVLMILMSLEGMIALFLTLRYFLSRKKRKLLFKNPLLLFLLSSSITLAFFAGLTSIIWGLLVRMKAPAFVFFVTAIMANEKDNIHPNLSEKKS